MVSSVIFTTVKLFTLVWSRIFAPALRIWSFTCNLLVISLIISSVKRFFPSCTEWIFELSYIYFSNIAPVTSVKRFWLKFTSRRLLFYRNIEADNKEWVVLIVIIISVDFLPNKTPLVSSMPQRDNSSFFKVLLNGWPVALPKLLASWLAPIKIRKKRFTN